jgi:hypothetical protein
MAEKRRIDERTSTQEPFGGVQGQGGFGGDGSADISCQVRFDRSRRYRFVNGRIGEIRPFILLGLGSGFLAPILNGLFRRRF